MNRPAADFSLLSLMATVILSIAPSASAQLAPSSNAPVDITADQTEALSQSCVSTWTGDAEALQATSRLRANVIKFYSKVLPSPTGDSSGQKCGQLDRMEADGAVYYVTPTEVVKGDHAIYLADTKTITVTGDVVVSQGRNVSSGTRLVINTDTGVATMASDVTGRGRPGRVRAVVYPNQPTGAGSAQRTTEGGARQGGLKAPVPPPPRQHGA